MALAPQLAESVRRRAIEKRDEAERRLVERLVATAPVGEDDPDSLPGPKLRDNIVSETYEVGDVLGARVTLDVDHAIYVVEDTLPHPIDPVNARVLRFRVGGIVVFAHHVDHPGTRANPFWREALDSWRELLQAS